jgi:prokaryotic ubiquitin-like protein Pup
MGASLGTLAVRREAGAGVSDGGQTRKGGASREQDDAAVEETTERTAESRDVVDDVDELLDEIDDVLEENAEEFVRSYVQKGGQ